MKRRIAPKIGEVQRIIWRHTLPAANQPATRESHSVQKLGLQLPPIQKSKLTCSDTWHAVINQKPVRSKACRCARDPLIMVWHAS